MYDAGLITSSIMRAVKDFLFDQIRHYELEDFFFLLM